MLKLACIGRASHQGGEAGLFCRNPKPRKRALGRGLRVEILKPTTVIDWVGWKRAVGLGAHQNTRLAYWFAERLTHLKP